MSNPRGSRPVIIQETPGADVVISDIQADTFFEIITIANRGTIDQPLAGWALASLHGTEVFTFPEDRFLAPDGQLRIVSGEQAAPSRQDLVWTRQNVWNNRSDTVLLFDPQGREVNRFSYPRPTIREERKPKRKILVQDVDGYHLRDWDDIAPPPSKQEFGL